MDPKTIAIIDLILIAIFVGFVVLALTFRLVGDSKT